jgi:hypothetical protein
VQDSAVTLSFPARPCGGFIAGPERPHVFGWGFDSPASIASDGTHVWVANSDSNSVTELSARTGRLVQVIAGSRFKFSSPWSIASDGTHVWVSSLEGTSVTELSAATGGHVGVISGSRYKFGSPDAIALERTSVWVANATGQSATEFPAT